MFISIFMGSFCVVYARKGSLLKALMIPYLALLTIDVFEYVVDVAVFGWIVTVVDIFVYSIIAVVTHRILLLGSGSVGEWGLKDWGHREMSFFLRAVALMCLSGVLIIVGTSFGWFGLIAAVCLTAYMLGRVSLVFPGIAIDKGMTFKESWYVTRNHQLLMSLVVAIVPIFMAIPVVLLSFIPYSFLLVSVMDMITSVLVVACLSLAYNELVIKSIAEEG